MPIRVATVAAVTPAEAGAGPPACLTPILLIVVVTVAATGRVARIRIPVAALILPAEGIQV